MLQSSSRPSFRSRLLLGWLWLLGTVLSLPALATAPTAMPPVSSGPVGWAQSWSIPDLDGDHAPEVVGQTRLNWDRHGYVHTLAFQLSTGGAPRSIEVHTVSSSPVSVAFRDVDSDGDLDVIVTSGLAHQPVALWLNEAGALSPTSLDRLPASPWGAEVSLDVAAPQGSRLAPFLLSRTIPLALLTGGLHWIHAPPAAAICARPSSITASSASDSSSPRGPPALL